MAVHFRVRKANGSCSKRRVEQGEPSWPRVAAIFGASGGIGAALAHELAQSGVRVYAGSRGGAGPEGPGIEPFRFDLTDEASIAGAVSAMAATPPQLVIVASGVLTPPDGPGPEKGLRMIDGAAMEAVFRLNTIGPALIAKHILPIMPRQGRAVFAALSARVGSIGDNRLGGWHSYRASKAALNMLIRNFAIEMARRNEDMAVVALHPGTVDTALSAPFRANLAEGQLTSPASAARNLLAVIDRLGPHDSGKVFDWKGEIIPA
ncbi:MAG: SDR family NAD(P)-dependent oxidoreductase [Sphingomonadales bacterium]|nr:SDR family NAD(P)-dependent oxidoreductase [Sphingomonadales bacterium]MBD3772271.1 SDR family NAD(P)-dependent oxidoreductase [Paracoccaceae bacterium]